MKTEKTTHLITILKDLLDGNIIKSSDQLASNSNQYFGSIKRNGFRFRPEKSHGWGQGMPPFCHSCTASMNSGKVSGGLVRGTP